MFDLHNDFPTALPQSAYRSYYGGAIDALGDGAQITSVIWTSELRSAQAVTEITQKLIPFNAPIAIEDLGILGDCFDTFDFSPYFYCSLTWNYDNDFAGGALEDGTLSAKGRALIDLLNASSVAVDLAHLNRRSFYEALECARRPMCSHTGFADHPRCLDARQVSALIERGAPIGICAVIAFTGAATVKELAQTICDFCMKYGDDNLCIGTDFNGSNNLPVGFESYADVGRLREELSSLGLSEPQIQKVLFGNATRFYEEIQHERHLR